jgi:hypothetical protein
MLTQKLSITKITVITTVVVIILKISFLLVGIIILMGSNKAVSHHANFAISQKKYCEFNLHPITISRIQSSSPSNPVKLL